jgi:hypothetical protein
MSLLEPIDAFDEQSKQRVAVLFSSSAERATGVNQSSRNQ